MIFLALQNTKLDGVIEIGRSADEQALRADLACSIFEDFLESVASYDQTAEIERRIQSGVSARRAVASVLGARFQPRLHAYFQRVMPTIEIVRVPDEFQN